ncbi:uncharacterized protein tant [Venturia canescens]|uniref:uncharacterized protein tant n=1 Tax=Venturia canescens TaxID=32260 RepID=UPI001C9C0EC1|nr:uncharacterized protein LOC122409623 [Venturia canescens]
MAEENPAAEVIAGTEGNLPDVVASLEMLTVTASTCNTDTLSPQKMLLRRRIRRPENPEVRNRRCSLRPKKRSAAEMEDEKDVKNYYLDKSVRKTANNLETIFEAPDEDVAEDIPVMMSAKRFKRMIHFQSEPNNAKIKKRRARVKRIFGSKFLTKHRAVSMQTLINKLNLIRSEPTEIADDKKPLSQVLNPFDAIRRCSLRQ